MQLPLYFFQIGAGILIVIAIFRKVFLAKPWYKPFSLKVDITLFSGCLVLLGLYFYAAGITIGIFAVIMGGAAIGKYLYDQRKS